MDCRTIQNLACEYRMSMGSMRDTWYLFETYALGRKVQGDLLRQFAEALGRVSQALVSKLDPSDLALVCLNVASAFTEGVESMRDAEQRRLAPPKMPRVPTTPLKDGWGYPVVNPDPPPAAKEATIPVAITPPIGFAEMHAEARMADMLADHPLLQIMVISGEGGHEITRSAYRGERTPNAFLRHLNELRGSGHWVYYLVH